MELKEQLSNISKQFLAEAKNNYNKEFISRTTSETPNFYSENIEKSASSKKNYSPKSDLVPALSIQTMLRPLYGKIGVNNPYIGNHPLFEHLKGTNKKEYSNTITFFMDLQNSTRLGSIYEPEDVQYIKNTFIRATIEFVKCFDGHVHRIMGDAVMAFFPSINKKWEDGIIDALNCASFITYFVESFIIPDLVSQGYKEETLGMRIGIEFGEEVLWSSYGYPGMDEVTATSFYVDIASKLQHSAGRNQIMIGEALKTYIDFPDKLTNLKTNENGDLEPEIDLKFLDDSGTAVKHRQFLLNWKEYLNFSPAMNNLNTNKILQSLGIEFYVTCEICESKDLSTKEETYISCSKILKKNKWINFTLHCNKSKIKTILNSIYKIRFQVKNHGLEVKDEDKKRNSETFDYKFEERFPHWEHSLYRGLHFMNINIFDSIKQIDIYNIKFGVFIE